jgi:hypothetical protein
MLSNWERRALEDIARHLAEEDPAFAAAMSRAFPLSKHTHDVTVVIAALLATLCLALTAVGPGLVAALFAATVFLVRRVQFPVRTGQRRRLRQTGHA